MKKAKCILVTGANGGLGLSLCQNLSKKNYTIIGIDKENESNQYCDYYFQWNFVEENNLVMQEITELVSKHSLNLCSIINNAALQIVKPFDNLTTEDINNSFKVNVLIPFILVKKLKPFIEKSKGCVINISSIHTKLTKSSFLAYSVTKSALEGFTKSMAVELSETVKIFAISPAAVDTNMLIQGFEGDLNKINMLKKYHPAKKIGDKDSIADLINFLINFKDNFLSGSTINYDGGISFRLHDPE